MAQQDFTITITGERGRFWESLLGRATFIVRTPVPHAARRPEGGEGRFFEVDVRQFNERELGLVVQALAERFSRSVDEVRSEVSVRGYVPVLDEGVYVAVAKPHRWFG